MGERISGYVEDEVDEIISEMAEHHDVSKSEIISILLREGLSARAMRHKMEIVDAKLDLMIENLGGDHMIEETIEERLSKTNRDTIPPRLSEHELEDTPIEKLLPNTEHRPTTE